MLALFYFKIINIIICNLITKLFYLIKINFNSTIDALKKKAVFLLRSLENIFVK